LGNNGTSSILATTTNSTDSTSTIEQLIEITTTAEEIQSLIIFSETRKWQIASDAANITQRSYIFRNDDGGAGYGGSNIAASNTALTDVKKGQRMIARIQLDNRGDTTSTAVYKLQYDKSDSNWVDVKRQGEIHYAKSISGKDEETMPYPAAGSCYSTTTWEDGKFYEGRNRTDAFSLGPNQCTEFGFMVDTSSTTASTTYRLRLINLTSSSTLDTYTYYPAFTIVSGTNDTKRYSKAFQRTVLRKLRK